MLTRRTFLRTAAVALGGAALAACGATPTATPVPPTQTAVKVVQTQIVVQTQVVEKQVPVTQVVEKVVTATPVVVPPTPTLARAKVTGTFTVLQKQDYFPDMNNWLRTEMVKYFDRQSWPWDIAYEVGYAGGTAFVEKLGAASAAGTPPDLLFTDQSATNLWSLKIPDVVDDVVADVTAVFGEPNVRAKNDYLFPDKHWYFVPYFQRIDGGWYLEPVFKAKNIDVQKLRLYPELWEACLSVSDPANQMYGWGVTITCCGDGGYLYNRVVHGYGAYLQDETGQYCTFNTPQMVEAIGLIADLYTNKKWAPMLPPGVLAWDNNSNNNNWYGSKLAYSQNAGTLLGYPTLNNLTLNTPYFPSMDKKLFKDVMRFHPPAGGPVNKEFNSFANQWWCLFKGSKNQEAARLTMKYFLTDLTRMDGLLSKAPAYALPAYEKLWDVSKFVPTNQVVMDAKPIAVAKTLQIPGQYPGPANNLAIAAADNQCIYADTISSVIKGTPAKEAVKTAHDRYVKLFKQFNLAGEKA